LKVLVLGSNGLIGSSVFSVLSDSSSLDVYGTVRSVVNSNPHNQKIFSDIDVSLNYRLIDVLKLVNPDVIINCIGATKHKEDGNNPISSIKLNALFPHQLAEISREFNIRLIHISTDCVFSGAKGLYVETDLSDANDFYGRSKALGEVLYGNTLTIRASTIGHELSTNYGLLNWFLLQNKKCKGFKNAIFSGLPTVVLAQVILEYILDNKNLKGLYHIAGEPINKYDLLKLIADVYHKEIVIEMDESFVIDRSLDSRKFNEATGFKAPSWLELIQTMFNYQYKENYV
jgi:dTDP-4-dehydrorhamnose reductase